MGKKRNRRCRGAGHICPQMSLYAIAFERTFGALPLREACGKPQPPKNQNFLKNVGTKSNPTLPNEPVPGQLRARPGFWATLEKELRNNLYHKRSDGKQEDAKARVKNEADAFAEFPQLDTYRSEMLCVSPLSASRLEAWTSIYHYLATEGQCKGPGLMVPTEDDPLRLIRFNNPVKMLSVCMPDCILKQMLYAEKDSNMGPHNSPVQIGRALCRPSPTGPRRWARSRRSRSVCANFLTKSGK